MLHGWRDQIPQDQRPRFLSTLLSSPLSLSPCGGPSSPREIFNPNIRDVGQTALLQGLSL